MYPINYDICRKKRKKDAYIRCVMFSCHMASRDGSSYSEGAE